MRAVLDLQLLALAFLELIVIGDFEHNVANLTAEHGCQLIGRSLRIFERVVQYRGDQHRGIRHAGFLHQHVGQINRVIDVRRRLGVFAPLVAVLVCRESNRFQKQGVSGLHTFAPKP